jgi:sigma-B regulation protein RsbU (phosphoserine phosphatase)
MTQDVKPPEADGASGEKILLVEDNKANLQILYELLETTGCRLLVARSGEAALAVVKRTAPDLILLDIMLPGIDGFEVCRRLKSDPATGGIPVIFLSALDETADKVRGLALGAVDYVSKPFQAEEVIARVNTHLTIHRLNREVRTQKSRLEHELAVVAGLQRRMLPGRLPAVDGMRLAVHYATSRFAGGDYYDAVALPGGRYGFLVADAEGHSAPATVMMAMTCALFRSRPDQHGAPDQVLASINRTLCGVNHESFVTAVFAVYEAGSRSLRLARAGHPPPLLFRPSENRVRPIPVEAVVPMGFQDYDRVPMAEITLQPGDRLLFYTDGITERFDPENQPYGEGRLCRQLERPGAADPQQVVDAVVRDMEAFARGRPPDDDQALLVAFVD